MASAFWLLIDHLRPAEAFLLSILALQAVFALPREAGLKRLATSSLEAPQRPRGFWSFWQWLESFFQRGCAASLRGQLWATLRPG